MITEYTKTTLSGMLSNENTYKIPLFQRDFSWEEKNFNDFLNDILRATNFTIKDDFLTFNEENSNYFFGTFLMIGRAGQPEQLVVDGQQRLTTTTIFLSAINKIISELDPNYKTSFENAIKRQYSHHGQPLTTDRLINSELDPILNSYVLDFGQQVHDDYEVTPQNSQQVLLKKTYE